MSLGHNDLVGTIYPFLSIDEFSPKSGTDKEVMVIAFYLKDDAPAQDLNTFIQRGSFDVLDADASPNPDEDGRYLVFVEFERNALFRETFPLFLRDVENITGPVVWEIKPYLADRAYGIDDPLLQNFIITSTDDYQTKDEFKMSNNIEETMKSSMLTDLTITENHVIFTEGPHRVGGHIIDFGKFEKISSKHKLKTRPINFSPTTEINTLDSILGENWNVYDMNGIVAVEGNNGDLLLMDDVQYIYNRKL